MCDEWLNNFETFREWSLNNNYQEGLHIDRINSNGNYEPSNCRYITCAQNMSTDLGQKKTYSNSQTGFKGVSPTKDGGFIAQISHNKVHMYLGYFKTVELALSARTAKEVELFGKQVSNLNLNKGI
jgi:hypothetical protein